MEFKSLHDGVFAELSVNIVRLYSALDFKPLLNLLMIPVLNVNWSVDVHSMLVSFPLHAAELSCEGQISPLIEVVLVNRILSLFNQLTVLSKRNFAESVS